MMFSPMIFAAVEPQLPLPTMHTVLLFTDDKRDFFVVVDFFVVAALVAAFAMVFLVVAFFVVMDAVRAADKGA
jgi:flagellar biosynthesis protein FliP